MVIFQIELAVIEKVQRKIEEHILNYCDEFQCENYKYEKIGIQNYIPKKKKLV